MTTLHSSVRQQAQKNNRGQGYCSLTSLAVSNTCNASVKSKGFCDYKCTNEREFWDRFSAPKSLIIKRHLAVDTLWACRFLPTALKPVCQMTKAEIQLVSYNLDKCSSQTRQHPKSHDSARPRLSPDKLTVALQVIYPQVMTKIRFQLAPKPTKAEKAAQGKAGFVPVATRWVIERSNAGIERCKSLVKNFESTLSHATAKLNLCFIRLMLKRLANE